MRRFTLTEWIVLLVALGGMNLFLLRLSDKVREVRARHAQTIARAAYEARKEECVQHVDWYAAAEVLREDERTAATAACIVCTGPQADSHVCRYWLNRLDGHLSGAF